MNENKIILTGENGEQETFCIIDQTKLNGINYILVTEEADADEEEPEAYIMKDVSKEDDAEAVYEFVEDDKEFEALADVFGELVDEETDLI